MRPSSARRASGSENGGVWIMVGSSPRSIALTMATALAMVLGCNFTFEPDPGATAGPEIFDESVDAGLGSSPPEGGESGGGGAEPPRVADGGEPGFGGAMAPQMDAGVSAVDGGLPGGDFDGAVAPEGPDAGGDEAVDAGDAEAPCPDADDDLICDIDDMVCNADGQPLTCLRAEPPCPDATVPVVVDGCFTDACVGWADCVVQAPCDDVDRDGVCDAEDPACNADDQPLACAQPAPRCPPDTVPVIRNGCYDGCVAWDACRPAEPCPDADGDGICDARDDVCNADGVEVMCERVQRICPDNQVVVAIDGCYTDRCVTWAECVDPGPCDDTDGDGVCDVDDSECNTDGRPVACRRAAPPCPEDQVAEVTDGCYTGRCVTWEMCADAGGMGCRDAAGCEDAAYCGVAGACHPDGTCRRDADCVMPGNAFDAPLCEGWTTCEENACNWVCGDPRCTDLAGVDLGPCEQELGVARVDGQCVSISGCRVGVFRLFPTLEECRRGCR